MPDRAHDADTMEFHDAFHTMRELYEQRAYYHALYVNAMQFDFRRGVASKSWRHHDGEPCFGYTAPGTRWFIVTMQLPSELDETGGVVSRTGKQVTQHYPEDMWDAFHIPETEVAPVWDGHDAKEGNRRMRNFLGLWEAADDGPAT